jgi:hypothetical protein
MPILGPASDKNRHPQTIMQPAACPIPHIGRRREVPELKGIVSLVIAQAIAVAQRVSEAAAGRGLENAIDDFAELLATLPDSPTGTMGADDLAALRAIAETVIEEIERRIETRTARLAKQVTLAQAVYRIQQALENIDRWHHHVAAAEPIPPARS